MFVVHAQTSLLATCDPSQHDESSTDAGNLAAPVAPLPDQDDVQCEPHCCITAATLPVSCPYNMDDASGVCWVEPTAVSTVQGTDYTCPPGSNTNSMNGSTCLVARSFSCAHQPDTVYIDDDECRYYQKAEPANSHQCPQHYYLVGESICRRDYKATGLLEENTV
jgi:hypothetical protein